MESHQIRLLLVEDHTMVRKGMKAFLGEYEGISVIGEAADGLRAVQLVEQLKPDVVLVDLNLPGIDGIETIRRMIAIRSEQRAIVLTAYDEEDKIDQAAGAGAMGYLVKNIDPEELVQSIRSVNSGIPAFSNMVLWRLLTQKEDVKPFERHKTLTTREVEVLRLLASGYTDQEIADELWLTSVTVRTHINRVITKLGLKNRVQAALYAIRSGLITLEEARRPRQSGQI
jgi:two-component system, NarL family, response regulator LiaR